MEQMALMLRRKGRMEGLLDVFARNIKFIKTVFFNMA